MKKYFINVMWLVFFTPIALNAGNEIPNGSFEAGQSCKPDDQSQVDMVGSGNTCTTCLFNWENFNTSDWYTQVVGFPCLLHGALFNGTYDASGQTEGYNEIPGLPVLSAHTGVFYAGFGACEGLQVKLNHKVGGINKMIRISFWFSPRTKEDTKINVYLLRDRVNDNTNIDCYNPGIDTEVSFEIDVNSEGVDAIHIPGEWYYFETVIFACPGDPEYEYLAIKGENGVEGRFRSREYVYVDDFVLEEEDFCNHPCASSVGGSYMEPSANDPNFPNATSGSPINGLYWSVALFNILGYKFTVFDMGWDGVYDGDPGIYHIQEFDPNGLTLPTGPMVVSWTGENSFGNCVPIGAYPFVLEFWNCNNHVIVDEKTISYLGDGCSFIQPFVTPCFNSPCGQRVCAPDLLVTTAPLNSLYQASNSVVAQNQFIVIPNQRVDITAGTEIILGEGFVAEEGSELRARIAPCDVNSQRFSADTSSDKITPKSIDSKSYSDFRRNSQSNPKNIPISEVENISSDGIFTIHASRQMEYDISIYNSVGQLVYCIKKANGDLKIDLSNQMDGFYYYVLFNEQIQMVKGVLLKIE